MSGWLIIDEMVVNPRYYEKMSELLDALIAQRKREALDYKAYLARIVELTRKVAEPEAHSSYPSNIDSTALRSLYDNLSDLSPAEMQAAHGGSAADHAVAVDAAIRSIKKDGWRGNRFKEREVRNAIMSIIADQTRVDSHLRNRQEPA